MRWLNILCSEKMENYYTAKKLIQQRIEAERLVASIQEELKEKKNDIEIQKGLAEQGLDNILAFEKGRAAKISLSLIQAQKELDKINVEIESHKLASDLQRGRDKSGNDGKQKFFTDEDFQLMLVELFKLELFQIEDFLEYQFSLAYITNTMSKFNWLTALKKNTIHYVPKDEDQEIKLQMIDKWHMDKTKKLFNQNKQDVAAPTKPDLEPNKKVALIKKFADIFDSEDWAKYVSVLEKTVPPLINSKQEFVGNPSLHKGVVCSWFKHLQNKGIVKLSVNRSQLATVLNNELKNFNVGREGKTFDNVSSQFEKIFKPQLLTLIE